MPRLAKVVNVLAIRQVKQGTETTVFRIGFTRILFRISNKLSSKFQPKYTLSKFTRALNTFTG